MLTTQNLLWDVTTHLLNKLRGRLRVERLIVDVIKAVRRQRLLLGFVLEDVADLLFQQQVEHEEKHALGKQVGYYEI